MSYFISYSRQELTFVDSLVRTLNKKDCDIWLDFLKLVPGRRWDDQVNDGIDASDAVLVVVSIHSMASEPVQREWARAKEKNKRTILLIFEACKLPPELVGCEWVDFRDSFSQSVSKLVAILHNTAGSQPPANLPPQEGFRMPPTPTLFHRLSLVTAVLSVIFVFPAFRLIPLCRRVPKRTYRFGLSRLYLAILSFFSLIFFFFLAFDVDQILSISTPQPTLTVITIIVDALFTLVSVIPLACLLLLWFSPGMYRWGGPGGSYVRSSALTDLDRWNGIISALAILGLVVPPLYFLLLLYWLARRFLIFRGLPPGKPMKVAIEYNPMNKRLADDLIKTLRGIGHTYIEPPHMQVADCVLILLSCYNCRTKIDLQETHQQIYPVITDDTSSKFFEESIRRLQWIDLRQSAGRRMKFLARLISYPDLLREKLGILPSPAFRRSWVVDFAIGYFTLVLASGALSLLIFGLDIIGARGSSALQINWLPVLAVCVAMFLAAEGIRLMNNRNATLGRVSLYMLLSLFVGGNATVFVLFIGLIILAINQRDLKYWLAPN